MSLTAVLAGSVCVVAAVVMLATARGPASRMAHAVMLGVMVLLAVGMQSPALTTVCAVVLVATAAVLLLRRPDAEARLCAFDVAACAALVGLMATSTLLAGAGTSSGQADMAGTDMSGMHMSGMHTGGSSDPVRSAVLIGVAVLVVLAGWAGSRRGARRTTRAGGVAAWLMMLAMAAMVTA